MNNTVYIITGAAGHLAEAIIRELAGTGCHIRGLLLPEQTGIAEDNISYITGDVTKLDTLDRLFENTYGAEAIVIHCAGIVSIQKEVSPEVYEVNVTGTKNIISKCIRYGVKRLVYVSSVHAIPEIKGGVVREVDSFSPDTVEGAYAKTKAEATQAVMQAAKNGLNAVIVHPSGIVGPYDRYKSNHLVQLMSLYLNRRLLLGVRGGYDFVDVRDVAEGVLLAAEKGRQGECYILSNRYIRLEELMDQMRILTGRRFRLPFISYYAAKLLIPICETFSKLTRKRSIYTSYSIQTLASNASFCHDKTDAELGYTTRSLSETVRDTVAYIRQEKKA